MDKVKECPYCGATFPHQGPTGCNQQGPDPHWMLDEDVTIIVERQEIDEVVAYVVQEQGNDSRQCVITWNTKGRMLFDGFDVDTESFMGFVGMLDAVNEAPFKKVAFKSDQTAEDL